MREDFVREQCAGDAELERELWSLLAAHERAQGLPSRFAAVQEVLGALETEYYLGRSVGRYHIEEFLARGGMSTVFRARDGESGEIVALKILTAHHRAAGVSSPPRLDHPNIARTLLHSCDAELSYTVMEYVEGETVSSRLRRSPFSPRELIPLAQQFAVGLAEAHRSGICHGDLKPANLMIDTSGTLKILDFGSPCGTTAYLAPERAVGGEPDPRSDIYSFGATLYEMATGERDFRAPARARVYPGLGAVIERCMAPDPADRYPDAGAVVPVLEQLRPPSTLQSMKRRLRWRLIAASAAIVACLAAGVALFRYAPRPAPSSFLPLTEDTNLAIQPALSPDGKLLAYSANREGTAGMDIWVQSVPTGKPLRLTDHEADDLNPAFSPDGKWIVFDSDRESGGLFQVSSHGGEPVRISSAGSRPKFSPDGKWISYTTGARAARNRGPYMPLQIFLLPVSGGPARAFHPEFALAHSPVWFPDSSRILFLGSARAGEKQSWWVGTLDGAPPHPVSRPSSEVAGDYSTRMHMMLPQCWLPGSRIVFQYHSASRIALMAAPFSLQESRFTGPPQNLVVGADQFVQPACGSQGELVFASLQASANLWSISLDQPRQLRPATRPRRGLDGYPSLTADGKGLVYVASTERGSTAALRDLEDQDDRVLADQRPRNLWFRQSADGSRFASLDDPAIGGTLRITNPQGTVVQSFAGVKHPLDFTADGRYLLTQSETQPSSILLRRAGSDEAQVLLRHLTMKLQHARFSPDRRWIAFSAAVAEEPPSTFVAPFRDDSEIPLALWKQAATVNAVNAEWSPNGQKLYFLSEHEIYLCLFEQRLDRASKSLVGSARPVHHFHHATHSVWEVPLFSSRACRCPRQSCSERRLAHCGDLDGSLSPTALRQSSRCANSQPGCLGQNCHNARRSTGATFDLHRQCD